MLRVTCRGAVVVCALLALALPACGDDDDSEGDGGTATAAEIGPEVQDKIDAAKKKGKLKLLLSGDFFSQQLGEELASGFQRYYGDPGIKVDWAIGPSGQEIGGQLTQTAKAGLPAPTDVTWVPVSGVQARLRDDLVKMPIDWGWAPNIAGKELTELDGGAVRAGTFVQGFTYNTNELSEDEVPKTLEGVLDLPDDVALATTPYASGFGAQFTDDLWGEQRTFDWARKFAGKVDGFVECGSIERIASGEFALQVYDCGISETIALKEEGAPVDYVIPTDVPFLSYFYLMVPPNASNPVAAELWINWLLSPEAQEILWKEGHVDLHTLDGSKSVEIIEGALAGKQPVELDVDFVQANADVLDRAEEIETIFTSADK